MKFTNPNQFERIRRLEGIKTREDIWDTDTFADIRAEIEKKKPNIREELNEQELVASPELKSCVHKTRTFCAEISDQFKQKFLLLLEEQRKKGKIRSQKIVDYIQDNNFDLPSFVISRGDHAQELMQASGFTAEIKSQSVLLMFQLPKPLAQFWWKGGTDSWGEGAKDVEDAAITWGHFYRELMPVIWETQRRYENEHRLTFERINDIGKHDPKKYYYLWEISEWERDDKQRRDAAA